MTRIVPSYYGETVRVKRGTTGAKRPWPIAGCGRLGWRRSHLRHGGVGQLEGCVVLERERVLRLVEEHLGSQFPSLAVALVVEALYPILIALFVLLEEQLHGFVHRDDEFVGKGVGVAHGSRVARV
jgi:hypothetical protein